MRYEAGLAEIRRNPGRIQAKDDSNRRQTTAWRGCGYYLKSRNRALNLPIRRALRFRPKAMKKLLVIAAFSLALITAGASSVSGSNAEFQNNWFTGSYSFGSFIHAHDFEGDGEVELVYGRYLSNSTIFNIANSDFSIHYCWTILAEPVLDFVFHDVDSDGVSEVIVGSSEAIRVLRRRDCAEVQTFELPAPAAALAFGDFGADGVPDMAFVAGSDLFASVWNAPEAAVKRRGFGGTGVSVEPFDDVAGDEIRVDTSVIRFHRPADLQTLDELPSVNARVQTAEFDGAPPREIVHANLWDEGFQIFHLGDDAPYACYPVFNLGAFLVEDIDADGIDEIVYGDRQWGSVYVVESDLTEQHEFENPGHGVTAIDAADLNSDGVVEVVWTSDGDFLVADLALDMVVQHREALKPPLVPIPPDPADPSGTFTIFSSEMLDGFRESARAILDPATGEIGPMERLTNTPQGSFDFAVGLDADGDGGQDLCVGFDAFSSYRVQCYDKLSMEETWAWGPSADERTLIGVLDLNEDGIREYALASFEDIIMVDSRTGQVRLTLTLPKLAESRDIAYQDSRLLLVNGFHEILHFNAATGSLIDIDNKFEAVEVESFDGGFAIATPDHGVGRYQADTMTVDEWFGAPGESTPSMLDASPDESRLVWRWASGSFHEVFLLPSGSTPRRVPGPLGTIHELSVDNDSSVVVSTSAGIKSISIDEVFSDGFEG